MGEHLQLLQQLSFSLGAAGFELFPQQLQLLCHVVLAKGLHISRLIVVVYFLEELDLLEEVLLFLE